MKQLKYIDKIVETERNFMRDLIPGSAQHRMITTGNHGDISPIRSISSYIPMFVPVLHTRLSQINRPGIQVMVLKADRGSFTLIDDASSFENHWPEQHKMNFTVTTAGIFDRFLCACILEFAFPMACSPATTPSPWSLWRVNVHRHDISWNDR